jgi:copper chaperone
MEAKTFSVPDIECDGCANAIKNALGRIAGIGVVAVDVAKKVVEIQFESPATVGSISKALDRAGFPPSVC